VSRESIRQILRNAGIRWLATKTWKASTDPDFIAKMGRVLDLYNHPPADGRVICTDEFGPLNLQPRPGRAWRPGGHPARLRATCRRTRGARHMIAALDLGSGQITYRIRERKRWRECPAPRPQPRTRPMTRRTARGRTRASATWVTAVPRLTQTERMRSSRPGMPR